MKTVKFRLVLVLAFSLTLPLLAEPKDGVAVPQSNPNLDLARQLNEAFVQVAAEVSPAVVVITVIQKPTPGENLLPGQDPDSGEDPLDKIPPELRKFFHQGRPEPASGQGSGVIIRADGYILTNRHVVDEADQIEVRLRDGRTFKGVVRGVDAPSDVAVVKIDARDLPVAKFADSAKTRVGEFAIAIGAPFALDYSVTFGHVSAKDRSNVMPADGETPAMTDQEFIQTDANINPGNSGGPLVNIEGEIIGINTLIRGLRTGIGFAVPSNLARAVADQLIANGKFARAWLGISIRDLREYPEYRDLVPDVQDGVVVKEIMPDGPAAKSDLRPGDVITAIDGAPVVTSQQLKDEIRTKKVGQPLTLDVMRHGENDKTKLVRLTVKPGEYREADQAAAPPPVATPPEAGSAASLGLTVKTLTHELADRFNVPMTTGVIVTLVDRDGPAADSDIKPGDIITSVNQQPVANAAQFRDHVKNANLKKGVIFNLISEGTAKFEILRQSGD